MNNIISQLIKNTLFLFFFVSIISCTSNEETEQTSYTEINTVTHTRATKKKVSSKEYYYTSLATFENGQTTLDIKDLAELAGKEVNFIVIYESLAPWAEGFAAGSFSSTNNDSFDGLLESYQLEITSQFNIDDENEGLVLETNQTIDNPIEAAKEISLIDHVMMVHVKEVPSTVEENEQVVNN